MYIFLVPCSNEISHQNFLSTIENGFDYSLVERWLDEKGKLLLKEKPKLFAWGCKETKEATWDKMNEGDLLLFYKKGIFVHAGKVIYKQKSTNLALELWPARPGEAPYTCVFFPDNLQKINLSLSEIRDFGGYSDVFVPQGIMPLNQKGIEKFMEKYGDVDNFLTQIQNTQDPVLSLNPVDKSSTKQEDKEKSVQIEPYKNLIGIPDSVYKQINAALSSGKKHLIFYGPPGTGKTTLAEYVARELSPDPLAEDAYRMLTASSSWSSQDLIGGYQPIGPGIMAFMPGPMLRAFDRPIVIDELNRCPIDKVIGPLFSVLSGQATYLPYRTDVSELDSEFYKILPDHKENKRNNEYAPGPHWRFICTLNTIDKTHLGQISYALSRRFAWIKIGIPENLEAFVAQMVMKFDLHRSNSHNVDPKLISAMWRIVNEVREIGGAPIIDFMKAAFHMVDHLRISNIPTQRYQRTLLDAFRMFILPLMDGVRTADAVKLTDQIATKWDLDSNEKDALLRDFKDLSL